MFEFFGTGGPFPKNYVKEWAGEMPSGDLATILGRSIVHPPDGYLGGPLEKGDVVVVDSRAYFLDRESGYNFSEVDFDTSGIKPAIHVEYGRYVPMKDAAAISRYLANICKNLDIPIGYSGKPGYHGSDKGISGFEPHPHSDRSPCYLHPQFLAGSEAQNFIKMLSELAAADRWTDAAVYLLGNYPVYMGDLETARELYAPELRLPAALRPLVSVIPEDADNAEIDYLMEKVDGMTDYERNTFFAVIEAGWHCRSVAEIINITENLKCFELRPEIDAAYYGMRLLEGARIGTADIVRRLEQSDNPDERDLATHITLLESCVSAEDYGLAEARAEQGAFTSKGYITEEAEVRQVYHSLAHKDAMSARHKPQEKESVMAKIRGAKAAAKTKPKAERTAKPHSRSEPEI